MFTAKSLFIAICFVACASLFGQPVVDEVLLTTPTITETMDESDVISTYTAPTASSEDVWVLPPTGTKVLTKAYKLAVFVNGTGQTGSFRFYFPQSNLRSDLIVE